MGVTTRVLRARPRLRRRATWSKRAWGRLRLLSFWLKISGTYWGRYAENLTAVFRFMQAPRVGTRLLGIYPDGSRSVSKPPTFHVYTGPKSSVLLIVIKPLRTATGGGLTIWGI